MVIVLPGNDRNRIEFAMSADRTMSRSLAMQSAQGVCMPTRPPTHALRLRAMANQIKSVVLAARHDPFDAQTNALERARRLALNEATLAGSSDRKFRPAAAFDETTIETWWHGRVRKPHGDMLARCDRVVEGASRWVEFSMYGSAVQRHFDALDFRCDDRLQTPTKRGCDDGMAPRFAQMEKCLAVADRCWSVLTNCAEPDADAIGLAARMAPGGVMPAQSFMFPSPLRAPWLSADHVNTRVFDVPPSARQVHVAANRFGLLETLVKLGTLFEGAEPRPWWYTGLTFDLASCTSMALIYALFGPRWTPAANVGESWMLIDTVNRAIFEDEETGAKALAKNGPVLAARMRLPAWAFIRFLCDARREYYEQLSALGISARDIFSITNPELASGNPCFVKAA